MAILRDADGKRKNDEVEADEYLPTQRFSKLNEDPESGTVFYGEETINVNNSRTTPKPPMEESKTQVWRHSSPKTKTQPERTPSPVYPEAKEQESDAMQDPVVGWVVIIKGAGKGNALKLGYGMNSIGKNDTERVMLNFGDEHISRTAHATITYDPKGRKFYVSHGGGKNLTYLNEQPVLMPIQLLGGEEITLGETTLKFIPLCGDYFDWNDIND